MVTDENKEKFERVVSNLKLDKDEVLHTATAVCIADLVHGDATQKLSPARLEHDLQGVSKVRAEKGLPAVQVMRVLCDVLYICSKEHPEGVGFTSQCSYLAQGHGVRGRYHDMGVCQEYLDKWLEFSEKQTDLGELFEYVSSVLGRMKEFGISGMMPEFGELVLPKEYDSHGYTVKHDGLSGGDAEAFELRCLMSILIRHFAVFNSADYRSVESTELAYRLVVVTRHSNCSLPVGVGCSGNVYNPYKLLRNQGMRNTYNSVFSDKIVLSRDSVNRMFEILKSVDNVKRGVI